MLPEGRERGEILGRHWTLTRRICTGRMCVATPGMGVAERSGTLELFVEVGDHLGVGIGAQGIELTLSHGSQ
jgi:hypothetical protein